VDLIKSCVKVFGIYEILSKLWRYIYNIFQLFCFFKLTIINKLSEFTKFFWICGEIINNFQVFFIFLFTLLKVYFNDSDFTKFYIIYGDKCYIFHIYCFNGFIQKNCVKYWNLRNFVRIMEIYIIFFFLSYFHFCKIIIWQNFWNLRNFFGFVDDFITIPELFFLMFECDWYSVIRCV